MIERASDDELRELRACQHRDAERDVEGVEHSSFVEMLTQLSGNPILTLYFRITTDLALVHGHETTVRASRWFAARYGQLAQAIERRDRAGAHAVLDQFLERLEATDSVVERRRRRP